MSMYNSAIQILSELALHESGVELPEKAPTSIFEQVMDTLYEIPILNESESVFSVEMVPVRTSNRLGYYLIEMEDLSRYMMTNRIDNVRDAVGNILECNGLHGCYDKVALVIDEASILNELEDLGLPMSDYYKTKPAPTNLGIPVSDGTVYKTKIRQFANSKEVMDVLTGRYGLPLIKKNYTKVGLLGDDYDKPHLDNSQMSEEGNIKVQPGDQVITEKDDKKKEDKKQNSADKNPVSEDASFQHMSAHDLRVQRIRDIMGGKYDDEDLL